MIERISQSFVKNFRDYREGKECGVIIDAQYVHGRYLDDPDDPGAKNLGSYFEFITFGTLPANGKVPMAVYNQNGKLSAAYQMAHINRDRVLAMMKEMNIEIVYRGKRYDKGRFRGTIDLVCRALSDIVLDDGFVIKEGTMFVIDMKYSGLLKDTTPGWNKFGWRFTDVQKKYHGTQAIQYDFLTGMPFLFWVVQSNNPEGTDSNMAIFHVPVTKQMVDRHIDEANHLFEDFNLMVKVGGLQPRPSLNKCGKCPLRDECEFRATTPKIETIHLNEAA